MFSWHKANSVPAKLDIQSNSQLTTCQNQKGYMIPREPFQSVIFVFIPVYYLPRVLLSLSKLGITIYTMSVYKSSQSSSQPLKPFVNYEIRLVLALLATLRICSQVLLPSFDSKNIEIHFYTYFANEKMKTCIINCVLQKRQSGNRCSPSTCQLAHFQDNCIHLFMTGLLK